MQTLINGAKEVSIVRKEGFRRPHSQTHPNSHFSGYSNVEAMARRHLVPVYRQGVIFRSSLLRLGSTVLLSSYVLFSVFRALLAITHGTCYLKFLKANWRSSFLRQQSCPCLAWKSVLCYGFPSEAPLLCCILLIVFCISLQASCEKKVVQHW